MGSTVPGVVRPVDEDRSAHVTRWRSWPSVERPRWSWLVIVGIASIVGMVAYVGQSWLFALLMAIGLAITLWQLFVPVDYEIGPVGLQRSALGRTRLLPWHAVQAYQARSTGVVLYQCHDPMTVDLLRSLFLPYPDDPEEMLAGLRQHLSHAVELPE
jgi:hypothetical protein